MNKYRIIIRKNGLILRFTAYDDNEANMINAVFHTFTAARKVYYINIGEQIEW
jgi:hypothetical protein